MESRVRIHKCKKGGFRLDYRDPQTCQRHRPFVRTKAEAEDLRDKIIIQLSHGTLASTQKRLVAHLMEFHLQRNPTSRVLGNQRRFVSFCDYFGSMDISEINKHELQKWFTKIMQEENLSERTCNRAKAQLSHFFKWCIEEGFIRDTPLKLVHFSENVPVRRPNPTLTTDEIKDILDKAKTFEDGKLFSYLYTLAHTGARRCEVLNLKWSDIDFALGFIQFRETKNGEDRSIRISKPLQEFLKTLPRHSLWLFTNDANEHLPVNTLVGIIKRFKAEYHFDKNWTLHSFRHSFAYGFKRKGGHIYELQAILGHKTAQLTTDLYGRIQAADIEMPSPFDF